MENQDVSWPQYIMYSMLIILNQNTLWYQWKMLTNGEHIMGRKI